jgi:type IV secretory pathway VirB4 component
VEVGLRQQDVQINPFALAPTPEHLHFLHAFVRVFLEGHDGDRLNEVEDREVYEAAENLYVLGAGQRRLFTLANLLPRALSARLHKWVGGGRYAGLFDNQEDTLSSERLQVFGGRRRSLSSRDGRMIGLHLRWLSTAALSSS